MNSLRTHLLAAATVALGLSCGSTTSNDAGTDTDAGVQGKAVEVRFKVVVGGQAHACTQTYTGVGSNPTFNTYLPKDARFYVHDVSLTDSSGSSVPVTLTQDGVWQNGTVALIDAEDFTGTCVIGNPGTNLKVAGTVPEGTYTGLKFKVGVPTERNHLWVDAQPAPLNYAAMFWAWTSGYRFVRIEGVGEDKKDLPGGLLHLGSTVCVAADSLDPRMGASCANLNVVDVSFDTFDTTTNSVVLDIARLFATSDLAVNKAIPAGCMSGPADPECPAMFEKLGLPLKLADGGATYLPDGGEYVAGPQTLFTKE